jgi:hypothetical protein
MAMADALDAIPVASVSAEQRFRDSLEMFDEGVALQQLNLARRHPGLTAPEVEELLDRWLMREGED